MDFCHLHVHTQYSLLDGLCDVKELVGKAKQLGFSSLAITDHGSLYGIVEFYKECVKQGIKPVIGSEFYICDNCEDRSINQYYHLVLIAKNNNGLKNLYKLSSLSYTRGYYYKPRIDKKLLKEYGKDLVCLTACIQGIVPNFLIYGNYEQAKKELCDYIDIFSKENVYVELQDHNIDIQKKINPQLVKLANECNVKILCTNDVHYINRNDSHYQDILMCVQTQTKISDTDRLRLQTDEFYLKSYDEMKKTFPDMEEYLKNTCEVADKCNVNLEFHRFSFPKFFDDKNDEETKAYLYRLCRKGLEMRYKIVTQELEKRLNYELKTICEMGFCDYFLIVWDFVRYAKKNNIPVGPGRGSAAGSLVSYVLNITTVDPIKYNLVFERFLNKERVSMPDIDIDFCYERRNEVIDYVINKYGEDRVAQIITFGTMKARAAIKDVARVLGVSYTKAENVTKLIGRSFNITIDKAIEENSQLKAMMNDPEIEELISVSKKLEGHLRHGSVHAAGVLIAKERADNIIPLCTVNNTVVTQFEKGNLEELGLLKIDFLGLRYITAVHSTVEKLKTYKNINIEFDDEFNDTKVYEMLSAGNTDGVFQLESDGMRNFLRDLKPSCFEDIIAGLSLYRPGPSDKIPQFIHNKKHPEDIKYPTNKMKAILDVTYGCMVYQEQVMEIFCALAGFSLGQADLIRRAISKKKADVINSKKEAFVNGCEKNGINTQTAEKIFCDIEAFANYAFNKSHATCYGVIAYETSYLKCHYPAYFYSSLIAAYSESTEKVAFYIRSAASYNVKTLPPRINRSRVNFEVYDDEINFGFSSIKGVGVGLAALICREREENGDFKSFEDFISRMAKHRINRNSVEALIKAGCFDNYGKRTEFLKVYEIELSKYTNDIRNNVEGQIGLFSLSFEEKNDDKYKETFRYYNDDEITVTNEELEMEREVLGLYVSGHPLNEFIDKIHAITKNEIYAIKEKILALGDVPEEYEEETILVGIIKHIVQKKTRSQKDMLFFTLEDISGTVECVVFPNILCEYGMYITNENIIIAKGKMTYENDKISFIVSRIDHFSTKKSYVKLYLKIDVKNEDKFDEIRNVLSFFNGDTPVYFYYSRKKKTMLAPEKYWVSENKILVDKLNRILGSENVKFVMI